MNPSVLILLFVSLVWGTTFAVIHAATAHMNGAEITTLRFLIAGLCMLPFAVRAPRRAWCDGLILGVVVLVSYATQAIGLQFISANRSAFLSNLNVLMVPFLGLLWGGRLSVQMASAAVLACIGIGLMSWEGGSNLLGDSLTVTGAFAYAVYMIVLSRFIKRHESRTLVATQIVAMAVISAAWLLITHPSSSALVALGEHARPVWPSLVYLGAVASAGMLFLQAVGQRHVAADKVAVIFTMEPVFASLFAWLWLRETLGIRGLLGGALVVAAVILGEWRFRFRQLARG